jgi:hypothetical protein
MNEAVAEKLAIAVDRLTDVLSTLLAKEPILKNELTLQQAAELLKVHPQTIHTYRRSFWIAGVHFFPQGKGHLYNRELLQDWLRNNIS